MKKKETYPEYVARKDREKPGHAKKVASAKALRKRMVGGYRLVPIDPTQKMLNAARDAFFHEQGTDAEIQRIWVAMLDASPTR